MTSNSCDSKETMNCAVCGEETEKHCSLVCQKCWNKKHSKIITDDKTRLVTIIQCPKCGEPIRASRPHDCNKQMDDSIS